MTNKITPNPCPICGKPKGRNKITCSMSCWAKYKSNIKKCIICGKDFYCSPSAGTLTCGAECSKINRQNQADGYLAKNLKKAHEVISIRPLTGKFETNKAAKRWKIQAPNGQVYECINLKNWLREHEYMLDGTVNQAWDGISKIKYSQQGKRKFKNQQWKGWRLLEWSDDLPNKPTKTKKAPTN